MPTQSEKNSGNFEVVRGGLYGDRQALDHRAARVNEPPKQRFARRVREIAATWKAKDGEGPYASRAIANTAHGIQQPLNHLHDQMRDAIERDVPLERVEAIGYAAIEEARKLYREKRRLRPAA